MSSLGWLFLSHRQPSLFKILCQCILLFPSPWHALFIHLSLRSPFSWPLPWRSCVSTNFILYHMSVVSISLSSICLTLFSVLFGQLRGARSVQYHHREALIVSFLCIYVLALTLRWPIVYGQTDKGNVCVAHRYIVTRICPEAFFLSVFTSLHLFIPSKHLTAICRSSMSSPMTTEFSQDEFMLR